MANYDLQAKPTLGPAYFCHALFLKSCKTGTTKKNMKYYSVLFKKKKGKVCPNLHSLHRKIPSLPTVEASREEALHRHFVLRFCVFITSDSVLCQLGGYVYCDPTPRLYFSIFSSPGFILAYFPHQWLQVGFLGMLTMINIQKFIKECSLASTSVEGMERKQKE